MAKRALAKITTTQLLYTLLLVMTFLVGYLFAKVQGGSSSILPSPQSTPQAGNQAPQAPIKADVKNGHLPALGNKNAKVKIVEFSDFQCPFCRSFFTDSFPQIKRDYIDTGKVVFYYRHFPLSFHPQSGISAVASECANDQGKFWAMHDKMYEEQGKQGQGTITYTADDLKRWAADIGVDTARFNSCLDANTHKDAVDADQKEGQAAGVSGTPTFYINGTQLVGAQPYASFKAAIDTALAK